MSDEEDAEDDEEEDDDEEESEEEVEKEMLSATNRKTRGQVTTKPVKKTPPSTPTRVR
jgi:hypothetical protein